uniref:Uncharacterized protein n=1 Tax=Eutreptiella gymnastica TaxID=73025 RepID=A0A7S4D186_9EUGL
MCGNGVDPACCTRLSVLYTVNREANCLAWPCTCKTPKQTGRGLGEDLRQDPELHLWNLPPTVFGQGPQSAQDCRAFVYAQNTKHSGALWPVSVHTQQVPDTKCNPTSKHTLKQHS